MIWSMSSTKLSCRRPSASGLREPVTRREPAAKVAYMMSRFPKLTETFILYEMLALEASGIAVELYPLLRTREPVVHPEVAKLLDRAHFHPFLSLSILWAQWYFIRRCPLVYVRLWFEVLRETWGSANFFIGALGIFPKVVRFAYEMMRQRITHVHAHFATHPALAGLIIHRLTGIPFSFTAHGSDLHVDRRMLGTKVQAAAFVVTISDYNRELIIDTCGESARNKIHVIHCGVDPNIFFPRPKPATKRPFRILCVGSFEEVKGHTYLIDACRLLADWGVSFTCDLIGEGPRRGDITAQITRLGLQDQIEVRGARPRHEVARMLAGSDVMALASVPTRQGKREGIPVALMEAMASGVPVVASAISGIPELVVSGQHGLLVPPRDSAALASALYTLYDDTALRRRMAEAGRERVVQAFNLHTNAAQLARLFH